MRNRSRSGFKSKVKFHAKEESEKREQTPHPNSRKEERSKSER